MQITVRNVNEALSIAMDVLARGKLVSPRGMQTLEHEGPFITTYEQPAEMVLFDPVRDANPMFHFFEALWILQGRDDVAFLAHFLPRMADFSDDGKTFHAPYGHRMRYAYGFDQIETAIKKLSEDKDSRQAVVSIWHPHLDWQKSRDVPCNDMLMFKIREGKLRMTVCCRSNDAVLGAYGANVVQFSTLLKYMAGRIGVGVGEYTQISDSFHVYTDNPFWVAWKNRGMDWQFGSASIYENMSVARSVHGWDDGITSGECDYMSPSDLGGGAFDEDLHTFFKEWDAGNFISMHDYSTKSFVNTVVPMYQTLELWRAKKEDEAKASAAAIAALDWRIAVQKWMQRRVDKRNTALHSFPGSPGLTGVVEVKPANPLETLLHIQS